jgi:AcrR family transcriptional regulator
MRDGSKTRAKIVTEALRLFARKGVAGTSIRDIAGAVGVAEAALYRHFPSKDALSRSLFLDGYARLAGDILAADKAHAEFDTKITRIVEVFCDLFDEDRALFTFLLLSQHAHLAEVPDDAGKNVVEAVRSIFAGAMQRREIRDHDADLLTAMALGIVAQPAIFTLYGRLQGPLRHRAPDLAKAILALVG